MHHAVLVLHQDGQQRVSLSSGLSATRRRRPSVEERTHACRLHPLGEVQERHRGIDRWVPVAEGKTRLLLVRAKHVLEHNTSRCCVITSRPDLSFLGLCYRFGV